MNHLDALLKKIEDQTFTVGIVGGHGNETLKLANSHVQN